MSASAVWKERILVFPSAGDPVHLAPLRWARLEGRIQSEPRFDGSKTRFLLETSKMLSPWPTELSGVVAASLPGKQELEKGDGILGEGRLTLPREALNFGETSSREKLAHGGIFCNLALSRIERVSKRKSFSSFLRRRILNSLSLGLPPEKGRLFASIVFGASSCPPSPEERERYTAIGLAHILAASGLQVSLLIGAIAFPFKGRKGKYSGCLVALLGLAAIAGYLFLAGESASILRAGLMGVGTLLGIAFGRPLLAYLSFFAVLLVMLIWNPFFLYDIGFQLSFLATWAILHTMPKIKIRLPLPDLLGVPLATILAVSLWVMPLQLHLFGTASPYSILANLASSLLVDTLTILGFLMAPLITVFPLLHLLFAPLSGALLWTLDRIVFLLLSLPGSKFQVYFPLSLLLLSYGAIALFFLFPKDRSWLMGLIFLLGLNQVFLLHPPEITFLSVGQGDSIACRTEHGHWVLVDAGPYSPDWDAGQKTVVPFLRRMGCRKIDLLILTHPHRDHQGGALALLKNFEVSSVWESGLFSDDPQSKEILGNLLEKGIPFRRPGRGERLEMDKMLFEVLSPDRPPRGTRSDSNSSSLVLRVEANGWSVLLTGDAEKELEDFLLDKPLLLKSDILKVAHHGSRFGSCPAFLEAVGAKAGIVSVGKNSFRQPDQGTLGRLRSGMRVFRTDEGAVRMVLGKRLRVENTRGEGYLW